MVTSRIWFTPEQKTELWERWKQGHSISAISRALERRNKTGVQRIVALHGGIAPPPRRRASAALKLEEREEISRGIAAGRSIRAIARALERSPSTICREIARHGGLRAYNTERPHSSLGYATPAAFAAKLEQQRVALNPPVASPALMRDNTGRTLAAAG